MAFTHAISDAVYSYYAKSRHCIINKIKAVVHGVDFLDGYAEIKFEDYSQPITRAKRGLARLNATLEASNSYLSGFLFVSYKSETCSIAGQEKLICVVATKRGNPPFSIKN